jgi:hypothetical protein
LEVPSGGVTPAAGAGGVIWVVGVVLVEFVVPAGAALVGAAAGRVGGLGM